MCRTKKRFMKNEYELASDEISDRQGKRKTYMRFTFKVGNEVRVN